LALARCSPASTVGAHLPAPRSSTRRVISSPTALSPYLWTFHRKKNSEVPRDLDEFDCVMGGCDATRMGDLTTAARCENYEVIDDEVAYLNNSATGPQAPAPRQT